ncbi:hypothetical protein S40293_04313, partial [Stachybotrys chartarum IBT 40293]
MRQGVGTHVARRRAKASTDPSKDAKFAFIIQDAKGQSPLEARKLIRSHCMRGKNAKAPADNSVRRKRTRAKRRNVDSDEQARSSSDDSPKQHLPVTCATRDPCRDGEGSEASLDFLADNADILMPLMSFRLHRCHPDAEYAEPIDTQGQAMIHDFFTSMRHSIYPIELCFDIHQPDESWYDWLHLHPAYLNSGLFMISILRDILTSTREESADLAKVFSARSWSYLRRTIALLQDSIDNEAQQLADPTAAVVVALAMTANLVDDDQAFRTHFEGLRKIIRLRGGLVSFRNNCKMQVKICQVDLGWSIKTGCKPQLYTADDFSWSRLCPDFFHQHNLDHVTRTPSSLDSFVQYLDERLYSLFSDMRDFCSLANHLRQTGDKLDPQLLQDVMLSLQYRLLLLDYGKDERFFFEEAIRVALLAFKVSLFMQANIRHPYELLCASLKVSVEKLDLSNSRLGDLKLWMLFVGSMILFDAYDPWVLAAVGMMTRGQTWEEVHGRLKGVMWIHAIHDAQGTKLFQRALAAEENRQLGFDSLGTRSTDLA